MDESRFRIPKTSDEEKTSIINSIPKSTVYKNKWAIQIFPRMSGHLDIVSKSLKIWIQYPNPYRFSSSFSLGIQTHARDVVYKQWFVVDFMTIINEFEKYR